MIFPIHSCRGSEACGRVCAHTHRACCVLPRCGPSALTCLWRYCGPLQRRTGVSHCHHVTPQRTSHWFLCLPCRTADFSFQFLFLSSQLVGVSRRTESQRVNQCHSVNTASLTCIHLFVPTAATDKRVDVNQRESRPCSHTL